MATHTDPSMRASPLRRRLLRRAIGPSVALCVLLAAVEAALRLSGQWLGWPAAQVLAIQYGGFWAGLLGHWQANFALQPVAMFATYWLLHAGIAHLAGNLAGIAWLGPRVTVALGRQGFWEVWAASVLGGAVVFGLTSRSIAPMVGASGGVFGLAAALVVLRYRCERRGGQGGAARRLALACGALVALNAAGFVLEGGVLAWQTHLGGALAGGAMAAVLARRSLRRP